MKTIILIALGLILFVLDWVALHDILKKEPNLLAEYLMIGGSLIVFGVLIFAGGKKKESVTG